MKKVFLLVGTLLFVSIGTFFYACESAETNETSKNRNTNPSNVQRGTTALGSFDASDNFTFRIPQATMLSNINSNLRTHYGMTTVTMTSVTALKVGGDYYLRATGGTSKFTELLYLDTNKLAYGEGISCSTNDCADIDGCLPNKAKTKCIGCWIGSDCKKTVTARSMFEAVLNSSEVIE